MKRTIYYVLCITIAQTCSLLGMDQTSEVASSTEKSMPPTPNNTPNFSSLTVNEPPPALPVFVPNHTLEQPDGDDGALELDEVIAEKTERFHRNVVTVNASHSKTGCCARCACVLF